MATIDYKQKIKDYMNSSEVDTLYKSMLNNLFPELAELEDEKIRKALIDHIKANCETPFILFQDFSSDIILSWLEKQGKKDEEILVLKDQIKSLHAAIKAIKETHRIELKNQGEQKSVWWSEEDEKEVAVLEAYIHSKDWSERHIDRALGIVDELVNKVKSLRPQKQWRPSEDQMKALDEALSLAKNCGEESAFDLRTLHEQLKKLRKE